MNSHHKWIETTNEKLFFMKENLLQPSTFHSAKNSFKPVKFLFAAPHAESVEICGDFNHWHPFPMDRTVDGWWFAQLQLCHGYHQYRILVDGVAMLDPHATGIGRDERNEKVSLIAVS